MFKNNTSSNNPQYVEWTMMKTKHTGIVRWMKGKADLIRLWQNSDSPVNTYYCLHIHQWGSQSRIYNGGVVGTGLQTQLEIYNICTFYEQLLSMAAQQGARQEGCKVYKGLSQQGCYLLQGPLQLCCNAVKHNISRQRSQKEIRTPELE